MVAQAMSTPLPSRETTLPRIKTRVEGAGAGAPPQLRASLLSLSTFLRALPFVAVALYVLDAHICEFPAVADLDPTLPLAPMVATTCEVASAATREAANVLRQVVELLPINVASFDVKNLLIKGVEDAHAALLDKVDGRTKVPFEPLNKAVLETLTLYNAGLHSVVSHLEDVWSGRHVSSEDKANAVVFACLGSEDCAEVEAEISSVAGPDMMLKVLVDESTTRGAIQAQISTFLKERPNGVVVVPRVERWSPLLLSVLNNCMGEGGSLIQDGVSVPTSSATWLLTAKVPLNGEMTSSSVKLSLGVKGALLEGRDETDEMVSAVLTAFRRRLDVVALGTFVL